MDGGPEADSSDYCHHDGEHQVVVPCWCVHSSYHCHGSQLLLYHNQIHISALRERGGGDENEGKGFSLVTQAVTAFPYLLKWWWIVRWGATVE